MWIGVGVGVVALALPFATPLTELFGMTPLNATLLRMLALLIAAYFAVTEGAKLWFFRGRPPRARPRS